MHVLTRRDRGGGKADDLPIAPDRVALRDRANRHLVPGRNALGGQHIFADRSARQEGGACDDDVVLGVKADDGRRCHDNFLGQEFGLHTAFRRPSAKGGLDFR